MNRPEDRERVPADVDVETVWEYPDEETLARAMLSSAAGCLGSKTLGEDAMRTAALDALTPYRTPSGGFRIRNEWHSLIASA